MNYNPAARIPQPVVYGDELLFGRHAESEQNAECRQNAGEPRLDIGNSKLSQLGRRQAELMGPELERLGVKRIITSPLRRAVGTAVIASADQDIEVIPEDELVEFNWGIARGMLVKKAFPPIVEQMASRGNHKFRHNPAAESNLAAHARVRSVVERYNQPGDLFMAHSWLLRAYFAVEVDRHRDELRQPEHKIGNAVLLAYRPGSRVWPRQVSAPPANLRAA